MTKLRLQPHLTVSPERVILEPWFRVAGTAIEPLGTSLRDWDSSLGLDIGFETAVDLGGVLEDAGLADDALVAVYGLLDCASAHYRVSAQEVLGLGPSRVRVRLTVEPGQLTGDITLSRGLVLLTPGTVRTPRQARSPGARLLDAPSEHVVLDSDEPRFPVESVSFDSLQLPGAAWMVNVDAEGPTDPFMACVRLLLNAGHPAVKLLEDGDVAQQQLVASALRIDTTRQLFAAVSNDERFFDGPFPDNSIGAVLESMARNLLAMSLPKAIELHNHHPDRFDAVLQARLHYLGG